jgi:kinesin family protein 3/17
MKNPQFDNLKVAIRVRPPLSRETEEGIPFRSIAIVSQDQKSISLAEYLGAELDEIERQREWVEQPNLFQLHRFTFDQVFDLDSNQIDVYTLTAKPAVQSVLEGYNSTIFAYGQTGTGKTYTMEGFTFNQNDPNRGIIQRTIEDIFNYIMTTSSENTKFIIRASYLQIYNEFISDLLKPEKKNLQIREDKKKGIYVDLLSEWAVRNPVDLYALLKRGTSYRTTSATNMNDVSSRSHAVFVITVEQMTTETINGQTHTQIKVGKLNLVDLAGSERVRVTGATGQQLEESKKINKSLSCLGNVINALTDQKNRIHIPYRDSKLTRLLEDSLGGNCKTTMIAMISPAHDAFNESLSTLYFAQRAKKIQNRPIVNEDLNNRALIRQYETELKNLRNELERKNKMLQSNELVMQLQEEKKQALEDKNEAIKELEKASRQYLLEREEKLNLEKKIQMMNSQMIIGGHKIEETPQFQSALKNQLKVYENKIQEIEKEKQKIEEDKINNEQYKDLLFKQRDIMYALTNKLNERDEAIAQLQEEIETFEDIEENNNLLSSRINQLEAILIKNKIPLPPQTTINNNSNTKNNNNNINSPSSSKKKYGSDKTYLPYEAENNYKQFENQPLIMLSPDEKVNELRNIIQEQENKINFLDNLSQKFMNTLNEDGILDINKLLSQMESTNDLYNKINDLNNKNNNLENKINEQNSIINNLNEQIEKESKNDEIILNDLKKNVMNQIENLIRNTNEPTFKNELFKIYKNINDQELKKNYSGINLNSNFINNNNNTNNIKKYFSNENININNNNNKFNQQNINFSPKLNSNQIKNFSNNNVNNNIINNNINNNNSTGFNNYSKNNNNNNKNNNKLKNKNYINKFINTNK